MIMTNKFAEVARMETTLSPLIEGREKQSMEELVQKYPEGITIVAFDFIQCASKKGDMVTFPVLLYKEDETKFFFGGMMLSKICTAWLSDYDDNTMKCSKDLLEAGGVHVKFERTTTNSGNTLYAVKIVK